MASSSTPRERDIELFVRGWCCALRDLCALGAFHVDVDLPGMRLSYSPDKGGRLITDEGEIVLDRSWTDGHGLVVGDESQQEKR